MALPDELSALIEHAGRGVLEDAQSFGAALDDYLAPETASRGVINLLVDAVRQGAVERLLRDIGHGAGAAQAVAAAGDQLARDRASSETGSSRWAVAVLGYAAGVVDRQTLAAQPAPDASGAPGAAPPSGPRPSSPPVVSPAATLPPVAPPPQGWPGWAPPAPQPPRRRTALVVVPVVIALLLVAGGIALAIILANDDAPRANRTEDPSTSTGVPTTDEPTTDDPDDGLTTADPLAIADLLVEVATESFPGGSPPEVTAQSWSTAAGNLTDGYPRDLDVSERADATDWYVRTTSGERAMSIDVEHEPSDGGTFYDWDCDTFQSSGDVEAKCTEITTSDGRTAIDYWYRYPSASIASHNVVIPSDYASGQPQVLVSERLTDAPESLTLAQLEDTLQLSSAELLRIAEDPRLHLPRPDPEPPLPSYGFCINADPRPAQCPEGIN